MRRLLVFSLALLVVGCGPRTTDDWLTQLKNPDVVKRRQAIRELGERTGEAARVVPALAEALRDENEYVRHDSATALSKFGSDAATAVPALTAALKDRNPNVRRAAEATLKKVAPGTTAKNGGT
jgi:HEAT repeat protein